MLDCQNLELIPYKLEDVSGMAVFLKSYPRSPLILFHSVIASLTFPLKILFKWKAFGYSFFKELEHGLAVAQDRDDIDRSPYSLGL